MVLPPAVCYPPVGTTLPTHLIMEFWYKVHDALVTDHSLGVDIAAGAIIRFRADSDDLVGDMRYHRNTEDVAKAIAAGVRTGAISVTPAAGTP